ncbi:MAG: acetate kinase [Candidatus Margulisbacteria bacterium]|nr:acetate kinase [Candidatus Margulisiibacteriota bacterium]
MLILVLNCGSSSVKYALYESDTKKVLAKGNEERIGLEGGSSVNHKESIKKILHSLTAGDKKVIDNINEIKAVGHRVVHGGDKFNKSVLITTEVLNTIKQVASLAPLHNPPNIIGIESAMEVLEGVPQIAVFDTAFHQTLPKHAYIYPVPYDWYENYGVRKYGFHGSSHLYVAKRAAKMLDIPNNKVNLITLHIGNGVSFAAIRNGISIDTSMGLTPLEGAMMGTRSGDIDPAIVGYMAEKLNCSCQDITNILNKKSGHLGITGKYTDRRDILMGIQKGEERSKLSLLMETYRIKKYIGAYMAVLGHVDALVFTAGVGENNWFIREGSTEGLGNMGIILDNDKNGMIMASDGETDLSAPDSKVKILMIPTNEEAVLVEDVVAILEGRYDVHYKFHYSFE